MTKKMNKAKIQQKTPPKKTRQNYANVIIYAKLTLLEHYSKIQINHRYMTHMFVSESSVCSSTQSGHSSSPHQEIQPYLISSALKELQ